MLIWQAAALRIAAGVSTDPTTAEVEVMAAREQSNSLAAEVVRLQGTLADTTDEAEKRVRAALAQAHSVVR